MINGFINHSDGNWECHWKQYKNFKLSVWRHWRDDEQNKYFAAIMDEDSEIIIGDGNSLDLTLVQELDNVLNRLQNGLKLSNNMRQDKNSVPFRKLLEEVKGIVIEDTLVQCNMTWAEVLNLVDSISHLFNKEKYESCI